MPKRAEEKIDLYAARARNYEEHYAFRKYVLSLPQELQNRYDSLAMAFPEWELNNFGTVVMSEDEEMRLIQTASQYGLQAWYLISFYTSEDGWNKFVGKFNALPPEENFRKMYTVDEILGRDKKLSTGAVDKTENLSTFSTGLSTNKRKRKLSTGYPQSIHNQPVEKFG